MFGSRRSGSGSTRSRSRGIATSPGDDPVAAQSTALPSVKTAVNSSHRTRSSVETEFRLESVNDVSVESSSGRRTRVSGASVLDSELDLHALSDYDITQLFEVLQSQNSTDLSAKFWTKVDLAIRKIIDSKNENLAELFLHCTRLPSRHCLALLENFPLITTKIDEGGYDVVTLWHESARVALESNVSVNDAIRRNDPQLVKALIINGELCEENKLKLMVNFPQIAKAIMNETNDSYLQALCEFSLIKDEYDAMTVEQVIRTNDIDTARELLLFAPLKHDFVVNLLDKFPMLTKTITQDTFLSPELRKLAGSRLGKNSFLSLSRVRLGKNHSDHLVGATIDYTLHYLLASATNDELLVKIALKHHSVRLAKYLIAQRETLDVNLKFTLYLHFKKELVADLKTPRKSTEHEQKVKRSSMRTVYPDEGKFAAYKDKPSEYPLEPPAPSYKIVELDTTCSSNGVHSWKSPHHTMAEDQGGEGEPPRSVEPTRDCRAEFAAADGLFSFVNASRDVSAM